MGHYAFLREKLLEGLKLLDFHFEQDENHKTYVKDVEDNLFRDLDVDLLNALIDGSGSELFDKENAPAKMRSTGSSSALMTNLILCLDMEKFRCMGNNFYQASIEKKLSTYHGTPNLDGMLRSKDTVVYIESKLLETYYEKPKTLSMTYLNSKRLPKEWITFLKGFVSECDEKCCQSVFKAYNGIQMLLHALGIYNSIVKGKVDYEGDTNVKLLNLYWKSPFDHKDKKEREDIIKEDLKTTDFFNRLNKHMNNMLQDYNIHFEVVYKTYSEFIEEHKDQFLDGGYEYLKTRYYL